MREIFIAISIVFIFSAEAIDKITGAIRLNPRIPFYTIHNELLARYPFSSVSVVMRSIGLLLLLVLLSALIKNRFFPKAAVFCVLGFMSILFAIQQLYTDYQSMTYQWTIAIFYTGIMMCIAGIVFMLVGFVYSLKTKLSKDPSENEKKIPQVVIKKL